MINLLPPNSKAEIRAARANVTLLRFNIINVFTIGLLVLILVLAYIALNVSRTNAQNQVKDTNGQIVNYEQTKVKAEAYKQNLALAKQIKEKQIRYSDALIKIGQALPSGVVLNALQLSPETIGQPLEIQLTSYDYVDAVDIKNRLSKTDLLQDVKFVSVEGSTLKPGNTTMTMSITIKKEVLQ